MVESRSPGGLQNPPKCTIRRLPQVVVVTLSGDLDDRASEDWRTRLSEELRLGGTPRFVAFDMFDANPRNSMSTRFQVAAYARDLTKRVEWVLLLMPSTVGASVVVRLIIGIVAAAHVSAVTTRAAFESGLKAMYRGERPGA